MKMRGSNNKLYISFIFLILITAFGLLLVNTSREVLLSDKKETVAKLASQGAVSLEEENRDTISELQSLASLNEIVNMQTETALQMEILRKEAERKSYVVLGISDDNGNARTTAGDSIFIGDRDYFSEARNGKTTISGSLESRIKGSGKITVYAVPIYKDQQVTGVLFAAVPTKSLIGLNATLKRWGNDTQFSIVNKDGTVLSQSGTLPNSESLFSGLHAIGSDSLENFRSSIGQLKSGAAEFSRNNTNTFIGYAPIGGTPHLVLAVYITESALTQQTGKVVFTNYVLLVVMELFVLLAVLFLVTFWFTRRSYKEQLLQSMSTDELTGLPNRNSMLRVIEQYTKGAPPSGAESVGYYIDISDFQVINNTFGTHIGDRVLIDTAQYLTSVAGSDGFVGRISGDNFFVFFPSFRPEEDVCKFADKIIELFDSPFTINGNSFWIKCSIGIINFTKDNKAVQIPAEEFLARCELTITRNKGLVENQYFIYDESVVKSIEEEFAMTYDLKQSILKNELILYYQPQYNCLTNRIIGYESLIRWKSPKYGMVVPSRFIRLAEQSGFIVNIGRFVIDQSFKFAKSMSGKGICVSCNCSAIEVLQTEFVDYVIGKFNEYELEPHSVAIEITESVLIESFASVVQKLKKLRKAGIKIYLDDFGTGYSSLNYLKNLPIHDVKIDKSFVDNITSDQSERDIIETIVKLAERLGLTVVAEGIESKDQVECLLKCGCSLIQGYYISRPVPEKEAQELLNEFNESNMYV